MSFGREVRRRRKAARFTLEQLAEKAGLTPNYVGSVEKGQRDPSLSTVLALARALKVPPGELLGGHEKPSPAALEAGRLFDAAAPDVQEAVVSLLRAVGRKRR